MLFLTICFRPLPLPKSWLSANRLRLQIFHSTISLPHEKVPVLKISDDVIAFADFIVCGFVVRYLFYFAIHVFFVRYFVVVVVAGCIYPPVAGQRRTLNIGRFAHFSWQRLLRDFSRNLHLLRSFK